MIWKLALVLFAIVGINHMVFGIAYVTAGKFMPYHAQALEIGWYSLDENYKTLFLALMKLAGAGGLVAGLVNLALVRHLYHHVESGFIWLLIITSFIFQSVTNYAVYSVYTSTQGEPPLMMVSIGSAVFLIATVLLLAGKRANQAQAG